MNREKSDTNCTACREDAVVLEGSQGYKYLGITEDSTSAIKRETFAKVKTEILCRVERLCMTKLNDVKIFRVINEHIGLLKLEPADYMKVSILKSVRC